MFSDTKGEIFTLTGRFLCLQRHHLKLVLTGGLSSAPDPGALRWSFSLLGAYVFLRYRHKFRTTRQELPWLITYGLVGFLAVQTFYFIAITRMHVSIGLIIDYSANLDCFVDTLCYEKVCSSTDVDCD